MRNTKLNLDNFGKTSEEAIKELKRFGLPLKAYKKYPMAKGWQNKVWDEFSQEEKSHTTGFGINAGAAGLCIIDLDVHDENKNGIVNFSKLCDDNDYSPHTFSVRTASGGFHLYYTVVEPLPNTAGKIGDGIDSKSEKGQVVGPTSEVINAEGKKGMYKISKNYPLEPLPEFLKNKILESKNKPVIDHHPIETETTIEFDGDDIHPYIKKVLEETERDMMSAQNGERNDTLNKTAFACGKAGATLEQTETALRSTAISSGLDLAEIDSTLKRSWEEGQRNFDETKLITIKKKGSNTSNKKKKDEGDCYFKGEKLSGFSRVGMAIDVIGSILCRKLSLRYNSDKNEWMYFAKDEGWEIDTPKVEKLVQDELTTFARQLEDDHADLSLLIRSERYFKDLFSFMKRNFYIKEEMFDSNPDEISTGKLIINLRTGAIRKNSDKEFFSKNIRIDLDNEDINDNGFFSPDKNKIDRILGPVFEAIPKESLSWLQLMSGQALTGEQPHSAVSIWLLGGGANGKTTFLNLLSETSGSYGILPESNVLLSNGSEFSKSAFEGARQAIIEELPDDRTLDTGSLKRLLGSERITARSIYQKARTFKNQSTIFLSMNALPNVARQDFGTWRRLVVINFPYTFVACTQGNEFEKERDASMITAFKNKDILKAFFEWRILGAMEWYANGSSLESNIPESSRQEVDKWRFNDEPLNGFVNEILVEDGDYCVSRAQVYSDYKDFAMENGMKTMSASTFFKRLASCIKYKESRGHKEYTVSYDSNIYSSPRVSATSKVLLGVRFKNDGDFATNNNNQEDPDDNTDATDVDNESYDENNNIMNMDICDGDDIYKDKNIEPTIENSVKEEELVDDLFDSGNNTKDEEGDKDMLDHTGEDETYEEPIYDEALDYEDDDWDYDDEYLISDYPHDNLSDLIGDHPYDKDFSYVIDDDDIF